MRGETTCPTCGGPAERVEKVPIFTEGFHADPTLPRYPSYEYIRYNTTAADPARVARLETTIKVLARIVKSEYPRDRSIVDLVAIWGEATKEEETAIEAEAALLGPAE